MKAIVKFKEDNKIAFNGIEVQEFIKDQNYEMNATEMAFLADQGIKHEVVQEFTEEEPATEAQVDSTEPAKIDALDVEQKTNQHFDPNETQPLAEPATEAQVDSATAAPAPQEPVDNAENN